MPCNANQQIPYCRSYKGLPTDSNCKQAAPSRRVQAVVTSVAESPEEVKGDQQSVLKR